MMQRGAVLVALALAACSADRCGQSQLPASWTLHGDGFSVEISRDPYGLTVRGADGRTLLGSANGGHGGDGYGSLGWATGMVNFQPIIIRGYTRFDAMLDPFVDRFHAVAASSSSDSLTLTLEQAGQPGCVRVTHRLRGHALRVEATLDDHGSAPTPRAWEAAFASPSDEAFLGFGERFNAIDQRGQSLYSWPEEGGLSKPSTMPPGPSNPFPNGDTMTYYPVPFFLSSRGYGFWLDSTWRNQFDLASDRRDAWRVWHIGPSLAYEVYVPAPADTRPWPYQVLDQFTAATGRPMIPPAWSFGPRRRINRGAMVGAVSELQAMRDQGLAISVADDAMHFLPNGDDLGIAPALKTWVQSGRALGYRMVAYYNPYISTETNSPLHAEAQRGIANQWFLHNASGAPTPIFLISGRPINVYTVDVSSPDAVAWFTGMFQRALDIGYSGWMYDFGEYVQADDMGANGLLGEQFHNLFPVLYQKAAHDALERTSAAGDWYYFARSGYTGSPQYAPMAWGGDPDASFGQAEGLPAEIRAGINLSLSGVAHWGSDIGGYKCLADGTQAADGELLARWIEAGAMSSNMHDEDSCSGGGTKASIWSSPDAQAAWRTYALLHTRMQPYFQALAAAANQTGVPVIRHPWLAHPNQPELLIVSDAYYVGPALLAAPVVVRGDRQKTLPLPSGLFLNWQHQTLVSGAATVTLPAPLGELPLLLRDGELLPLLDASIATLDDGAHPGVIGPSDVADVYDVVGLISTASGGASFRFADGSTLSAKWTGSFAAPPLPPAANDAALATCSGCWLASDLGGGLQRVRISAASAIDAGGLQLGSIGVARRLRWDLYLAP